ncbi:hypothetical protein CTEN210_07890 [Chaetoceros tenuissimus]|uniref:WW domain-containing protein n=1 Tax=Chaetoceros tenuissimus TaxID=426638 RepID=A0AAD3CTA4_9STRA|nr:hypothetical protein CTEN210_07890 [Chaetoceros tenuissimus]
MKIFKKSSSASNPNITPSKGLVKGGSFKKVPSTPPITPSPGKENESNISVRVISSKPEMVASKKANDNQNQENNLSSLLPENHPVLGVADDKSQSTLGSGSSFENPLFAAVFGLGCGPGLSAIPEETLAEKVEWGISPTMSGDESDEKDEDGFEMVLDQKDDGIENYFCQPCEPSIQREEKEAVGDSPKKKRSIKMPKILKNRKKSSSGESVASSASSKASSSTNSPKRKSRIKGLMKARKEKKESTQQEPKKKVGKLFHAKFHKKSNKKTTSTAEKNKDSTKGKWKCVHDPESKKVYFYHSGTRETTWTKPKDFVEWRVSHDSEQRRFFYNVITKETSWEQPSDFQVWREVHDPNSGKYYYYNVLDKKTTWEKPDCLKDSSQEESKNPGDQVEKDTEDIKILTKTSSHEVKGNEEDIVETSNDVTKSISMPSAELEEEKKEALNIIMDLKSMDNDVGEDSEVELDPPNIKISDPSSELRALLFTYCPDEKDNNSQLIEMCEGNETPVIKAIEGLVNDTPFDELRLAIFSYVKSTVREMGEIPLDERRTVWKKSRKATASAAAPSMNRVNTHASSAMASAYSMNSRMLSHMTGQTGATTFTEQTNVINNKSDRKLSKKASSRQEIALEKFNEKWAKMSLENSFEDLTDVTDEENDKKQVILDLKAMESNDLVESPPKLKKIDPVRTQSFKPMYVQEQLVRTENIPLKSCIDDSNDAATLESAYAADNDDETDYRGWEEENPDDISALSDSIGPSMVKRQAKEKKMLAHQKEDSLKKQKAKTILSKYSSREEKENRMSSTAGYTSFNIDPNHQSFSDGESDVYKRIEDHVIADASEVSWDDNTMTSAEMES